MTSNKYDLTGKRFGRLLVVGFLERAKSGKSIDRIDNNGNYTTKIVDGPHNQNKH